MRANVQNRIFASCLTVLVSGIVSSVPSLSALADERGHHEFREHDTHRFSRDELRLWRVGGCPQSDYCRHTRRVMAMTVKGYQDLFDDDQRDDRFPLVQTVATTGR